jgi:hypothetical protein
VVSESTGEPNAEPGSPRTVTTVTRHRQDVTGENFGGIASGKHTQKPWNILENHHVEWVNLENHHAMLGK